MLAVRDNLAWAWLRRGLLFALLWWVLSDGSFGSPLIVAATIAAATAFSLVLVPPLARWRVLALARFAAFFVTQSAIGGTDVARRALHLRPPVQPAFVERRLRLRGDAARVFFAACAGLLPGTLTAAIEEDRVTIHVIDSSLPYGNTLDALEQRVARLFGER
jgi:multicomponent Na+:H+ antiporter subunit E